VDQLSASADLIKHNSCYVDMAIWGPHGIRIQKAMKVSGLIMSPGGELVQHEYKGPPDFEHWQACWEVYQTAMIMLDACAPPYLIAYSALIGHYAKRYGARCWALIYQMETRFRRETMERGRRRASAELDKAIVAGQTHDFDPARPWEYIFRKAADEHRYWHQNVEEPAMLIITGKFSTDGFLDGDAPISSSSHAHLATHGTPGLALGGGGGGKGTPRQALPDYRPPAQAPPQKRKAIEDRPGSKQHNVSGGRFTTNRSGNSLCMSFNSGNCTGTAGNIMCPVDSPRRHNCSLCLSPDHGAHACSQSEAKPPPYKKQKKGKAGGK
jgi:hypothetical protein